MKEKCSGGSEAGEGHLRVREQSLAERRELKKKKRRKKGDAEAWKKTQYANEAEQKSELEKNKITPNKPTSP